VQNFSNKPHGSVCGRFVDKTQVSVGQWFTDKTHISVRGQIEDIFGVNY
jgi:hypothetical protein